jgi:putative phosphoesterase
MSEALNASLNRHIIGVISDTHGLLRPQALEVLAGSEMIIHAGDVGDPNILNILGTIAPVIAVRGNIDKGDWAGKLPETAWVELGGAALYVLHDVNRLDLKPGSAGLRGVISGHSHQPSIHTSDGVLYLNPGSAGPRRFKLPITVARLYVTGKKLEAERIDLLATI